MKTNFTIFFYLIFLTGFTQNYHELIGKWQTNTFPKFCYEFDSTGNVKFDWKNDINSYQRRGKFVQIQDTVLIDYEPLFKLENLNQSKSDTLKLFVLNSRSEKLLNFGIKVEYESGNIIIVETDKNGYIRIPGLSRIATLVLENNYSNLESEKTVSWAKKKSFDNRLYTFNPNKLFGDLNKLIIDDLLMLHFDFKANTERLLRINKNEIYIGTDYNPTTIYVGGILTRKK
jgi:hypothetical protein